MKNKTNDVGKVLIYIVRSYIVFSIIAIIYLYADYLVFNPDRPDNGIGFGCAYVIYIIAPINTIVSLILYITDINIQILSNFKIGLIESITYLLLFFSLPLYLPRSIADYNMIIPYSIIIPLAILQTQIKKDNQKIHSPSPNPNKQKK